MEMVHHAGMSRDLQYMDKLNTLRLSELCRAANDTVLEEILNKSVFSSYGPGDVIYRQGGPAESFCIVHSGVVEIYNETATGGSVIAYLGPTECVGELALLIGDSRTATAQVPEQAEVIHISREVFEDLFMRFPVFLRQMCSILAQRLRRTTDLKSRPVEASRDSGLGGSLRVFDLSIVIQTLIDSRKTGRLVVDAEADGEGLQAEVFFDNGNIVWGKAGRIMGAEAVYQLFQIRLDGSFQFVGEPQDVVPDANISEAPMSVLLEAARLQDELKELKKRLPDTSIILRPVGRELQWTDYSTRPFAAPFWAAVCRRPESVDTLLRCAPYSHERVYRVALGLMETGQVEVVSVGKMEI